MVIGKLICGHYVQYPSAWTDLFNASEYCPECGAYKMVWDQWPEVWHSDCASCPYHRTHGYGKKYAEQAAERHKQRYPSHSVSVLWYSPAPKGAISQVKKPEPIDYPETPPF